MIFIDLMGGLGNQLFQIFTVLAYELQTGTQALFPYSTHLGEANTGTTVRTTYWNNLLREIKYKTNYLTTQPKKDTEEKKRWTGFREPGFTYSPLPTGVQFDFQIYGYFQSWKYFHHFASTIIKKELKMDEIQQEVLKRFPLVKDSTRCISMHFRLGDYKEKQGYHPIMPVEYYQQALEKCTKELKERGQDLTQYTILYFCEKEDEKFVARERIAPLQAQNPLLQFVPVGHVAQDWEQLMVMAACRHHIIPNSSFSWWGAYLADVLQKGYGSREESVYQTDYPLVYYPSKWFGPMMSSVSTEDLCPPYWICVPVS